MKKYKWICRECRDDSPCKLTIKTDLNPDSIKPVSCVLSGGTVKWKEVKK